MMESSLNNKAGGREEQDAPPPTELSIPPEAQAGTEEKEHLQVYLRIRPFSSAETESGESQECVTIEPPDTVLLKPPSVPTAGRLSADRPLPVTGQRFQFSQVYGPQTTQAELFAGTVKDLVKDVLCGGNSLVFTYGVTNAGKTFTFQGPDADAGILPRSLDMVFSSIGERVFTDTSVKPQRCREFLHLSGEQQAEEAAFKRSLLRQLKESERSNLSLLSSSNNTLLQGSSVQEETSAADEALSLEVEKDAKFSVWVSFCEIYNENIHDLLEVTPSGAPRRPALRLSQDVKGNAFIKDLRWVQVNNAEEAYRVMKLGKKNQSFSSTRLNQLSSRSHSIFSLRILKMSAIGAPRVLAVSELCLCDLAGSERCAKTQNKGERLKEAGNINTSLLILGKCINALRHNQQARLLQHVPFRESKLTHYLQGFFCGRGRACMIVNINQCASMYDETLNVLKFSAVAQKVVVVSTRPLPIMPCRSGSQGSFTSSDERMTPQGSRRSSLIGWESSLEDVQEDEDSGEEQSLMEHTVDQDLHHNQDHQAEEHAVTEGRAQQQQVALLARLQLELKKERAESVLLEARVREEISREFSDLFSQMQNDFDNRLLREREILEERAERRLEIFKNLVDKMSGSVPVTMEISLNSLSSEVVDIQRAAEAARTCLSSSGAAAEREAGEQQNHKASSVFPPCEAAAGEDEEKRRLLLQLQQQTSELSRLQKRVAELQTECSPGSAQVGGASISSQRHAASLEEERRAKDEALAALEAERRAREDAAASLAKESERRKQECDALRQEVSELSGRLEAAEQQVSSERQRAEQASVKLEAARAREAKHSEKIQEKSCQVLALTQEVPPTAPSVQLGEEASELRAQLAEEKEKRQSGEQRLQELRRQLAEQQLLHRQEAEQLEQQTITSEQRAAQLRAELMELRAQHEREKAAPTEVKGQRQSAEELPGQEVRSQEQLEELKVKLEEEREACEQLRAQLEETQALKSQNSNLLAEVATLRAKVNTMEEHRQQPEESRASAELQRKLEEAEERAASLQTDLQEALQRRGEEEARAELEAQAALEAAQEVRRREVERRRELLAVAHEAIAQKEIELEKRAEEISRLKETSQQDSDKVSSLGHELERQREEASDLREKLADYKKQIQQIQKEISAMKEEEKTLRQKLSDADKVKKQLQSELAARDRSIQQLRVEQSADRKSDQSQQLYKEACKDLEAKQQVVEDMRATLLEQEETQEQMEQLLEEKISLVQELSIEVESLKGLLLQQNRGTLTHHQIESPSDHLQAARQEAARAQDSLKLSAEKHQAERRRWQEEKLSLMGQVKEAEDKRNQEMRRFAEDRERYMRQQSQLESQLSNKEQTMETWRSERDTLVAALEVQLQKLLSSQAEKDQLIQQLQQDTTPPPPEDGERAAELQAALLQREEQINQLREQLEAAAARPQEVALQVGAPGPEEKLKEVKDVGSSVTPGENSGSQSVQRKSAGKRASVSSQGSSGFPSVLDSSEISTENGRTSRFPRPELEISFSPLQPNRMALRRQGEESAVTVKISRPARKRKSGEMEKSHVFRRSKRQATRQAPPLSGPAPLLLRKKPPEDEVEAENRRNTRTKLVSKLTPHQEETVAPATRQDSQSSIRSRKEATLQRIGDFLQSSPTLLGSKAKKMMSLVSGRSHTGSPAPSSSSSSSSSLSLRAKKNKRKLYRPEISSPMDLPSHMIISREPEEEKESDHQTIKRRLRCRTGK